MSALSRISFAEAFAQRAHEGQLYGEGPYHVHLGRVAALTTDILTKEARRAISHCDDTLALRSFFCEVGYLHDVVEDTVVTAEVLDLMFGRRVAIAVDLVTDPPASNRRERKRLLYKKVEAAKHGYVPPRLEASTLDDWTITVALIVKCADRLDNLHDALATGRRDLAQMYEREHAAFRAVFYTRFCRPGWQAIEALLQLSRDKSLPAQLPPELLVPLVP